MTSSLTEMCRTELWRCLTVLIQILTSEYNTCLEIAFDLFMVSRVVYPLDPPGGHYDSKDTGACVSPQEFVN